MKFDIECETFDQYFTKECASLTQAQKDNLPASVVKDLFIRTGIVNLKTTQRIGFLGKMYILSLATGKKINILIEGEDGVPLDYFKKESKKRNPGMGPAERLVSSGSFVISDKELHDTIAFMNNSSISPAYSYLTRASHIKKNKTAEKKSELNYIVKFLFTYEDNKAKWQKTTGLSMVEFLILLAMYNGRPATGTSIYKEVFKGRFGNSGSKARSAFVTLGAKGLINRSGSKTKVMNQISSLGATKVEEIITKYALDC